MSLKEQVRSARTNLDGLRGEAAERHKALQAALTSANAEGVDLATNTEAFDKIDGLAKSYDEAKDAVLHGQDRYARLLELASQEAGEPKEPRDEPKQYRSAGRAFTESEGYKNLRERGAFSSDAVPIGTTQGIKVGNREQFKTLFTTAAGGDALIENDRLSRLEMLPTAPLNLLDVIQTGTTDSDTVEWVYEDTWTNAAAETSEGTAASESTLSYTLSTSTVREITHFLPVTKKMLADGPGLRSMIDARLISGVRVRLQSELLVGDGTAPNLSGYLDQSGLLTQAKSTDSVSDAIHKAITKVRVNALGNYEPSYIVIHPNDYEAVMLEKATTGDYYWGGPAGRGVNTIWGLVPIVTTHITENTAMVFDPSGSQLLVREGLTIAASDSHSDYFTKRQVAILASFRAAFPIYSLNSFCTVTGI